MPMAMPSAVSGAAQPAGAEADAARGQDVAGAQPADGECGERGWPLAGWAVSTAPHLPPRRRGPAGPVEALSASVVPEHRRADERARSSDCRRPSRRVTQRGSEAAMPWSWVMRTMVEPARCSAWKVSRMSAPVRLSRLPVGSSASSRSGSWTMARAMATRWRSPPESCPGPVRGPVGEPDLLQRLGGSPAPTRRRAAPVGQPERHVLQRRRAPRRGGTAGTRSRWSGPAGPTAAGRAGARCRARRRGRRPRRRGRARRPGGAACSCPSPTVRRRRPSHPARSAR